MVLDVSAAISAAEKQREVRLLHRRMEHDLVNASSKNEYLARKGRWVDRIARDSLKFTIAEQRQVRGKHALVMEHQRRKQYCNESIADTQKRALRIAYGERLNNQHKQVLGKNSTGFQSTPRLLPAAYLSDCNGETVLQCNEQSLELLRRPLTKKTKRLAQSLLAKADQITCEEGIVGEVSEQYRLRATTLNNIGCLHHSSGDLLRALAAFEDCITVEEMIGEESPGTLLNYATVLHKNGNSAAAMLPVRRALKIINNRIPNVENIQRNDNKKYSDKDINMYILLLEASSTIRSCHPEETEAVAAQRDLVNAVSVSSYYLGNDHPTTVRLVANMTSLMTDNACRHQFSRTTTRPGRLPPVKNHPLLSIQLG